MTKMQGLKGFRTLLGVAVAASAMLGAPAAFAVIITSGAYSGTDAGSVDTLVGYGRTANSDLTTETTFVNFITGESFDAASSEKLCDGSAACASMFYSTNSAGVFAIELAYYLIKTGAGSTLATTGTYACNGSNHSGGDDCDHFVFDNLASAVFGVFSFIDMGFGEVTQISKISHVDQFGGSTQVPEPGTLALLGAGLLILGMRAPLRKRG
jgi:hypothetical protein